MSFWSNKTVVVTGGAGFLGSRVVAGLKERGVSEERIRVPRSADCDLRDRENCARIVEGAHLVIHLAANVGGIGFNLEHPGDLFYDNLIMGIQMMEAARKAEVAKFVAIGTVCAYPKLTPVPFREDDSWSGYPEETNAPYGLAKKMLLVQGQAYLQQHGFNSIYLLPVNLYGPGDNFDPRSSHVIPALIRMIIEAREEGLGRVEVWGDGSASREFLHVADAAWGILLAAERYDKPAPVNLGVGHEISIRALVDMIGKLCDYRGEIRWDTSRPNGQPRRCLDTSRAREAFGFRAQKNFEEGLAETICWYEAQRPIPSYG